MYIFDQGYRIEMLATQPLALLPSLLGFVVFIHSAKEISAIPADIQGNSLDSSLFNLDPGAAEGASSDPTTQSYVASFPDSDDLFTGATSNSFLTDAETNQITEPYQSLSIANGDVACDINYSNELQLSNKVRPRGESCTSPQGIVGGTSVPSDNGDEPDDLGFNDFATNLQMLAVFQQNFDLCPSSRFLTSNIPVCRLPSPDGLITVIGAPWFNLRTVSFCTFIFHLFYRGILSASPS